MHLKYSQRQLRAHYFKCVPFPLEKEHKIVRTEITERTITGITPAMAYTDMVFLERIFTHWLTRGWRSLRIIHKKYMTNMCDTLIKKKTS